MHQHYSAEVAKIIAQLNSEDRKTASSRVQWKTNFIWILCLKWSLVNLLRSSQCAVKLWLNATNMVQVNCDFPVHCLSSACGKSFVCFVLGLCTQNFYNKRMKDGVQTLKHSAAFINQQEKADHQRRPLHIYLRAQGGKRNQMLKRISNIFHIWIMNQINITK